MTRVKKYSKSREDRIYKRLYSVLTRYPSAKVVLEHCGTWDNGKEYGQRHVKKNGECRISYYEDPHSFNNRYKKSYQSSCFYDDFIEQLDDCPCCRIKIKRKKGLLAGLLREMREHDRDEQLQIKEVTYGYRFKKKMNLK